MINRNDVIAVRAIFDRSAAAAHLRQRAGTRGVRPVVEITALSEALALSAYAISAMLAAAGYNFRRLLAWPAGSIVGRNLGRH